MTMPQATRMHRVVLPTIICLMVAASVYASVASRADGQIKVETIDLTDHAVVRQTLMFNPLDPMQQSQPMAIQDVISYNKDVSPVKAAQPAARRKYIKSSRTFRPKVVKKAAKDAPKMTSKGLPKFMEAPKIVANGPFSAITSLGWPALAAIGAGTIVAVVAIPIAASNSDSDDSDRSKSSP